MNLIVDMSLNKITKKEDLENNFRDFSLTLETHSKKSNGIFIREYEDLNNRVYAKIFELRGDVASPIHVVSISNSNGRRNQKINHSCNRIIGSVSQSNFNKIIHK